MEFFLVLTGIIVGAVITWLATRQTAVRAETRLELLQHAEQRLGDTFKAIAGDTLKSNNQAFLELANQSFEVATARAKGDLAEKQEAIKSAIEPLGRALANYEKEIKEVEKSRQLMQGSLDQQVRNLLQANQQLQKETANLVAALRTPQARGRWGELTLRRVAELAGMVAHCDFAEQESAITPEGRLTPDVVVHLPASRQIIVDAKVPLNAYLTAIQGSDEEYRQGIRLHVQQIRAHMNALAGKSYWDQFEQAPEFVVMFIPGESFLAPAAVEDPALIEDGLQKRVVIATPTTLVALLRAIAYGWRQEQLAQGAREISDLGRQLYDRMANLTNHFAVLGKHLSRTVGSYNQAVGTLESRVLPSTRRFQALGVGSSQEIPFLQPVLLEAREPSEIAEDGAGVTMTPSAS